MSPVEPPAPSPSSRAGPSSRSTSSSSTSTPTLRPVSEAQLPVVVALATEAQRDPARHCGYLGTEPDDLATALRGLEPLGLAGALVAWDGDRPLGLLGADWDDAPPRVWWQGPLLATGLRDPEVLAARLLVVGRRLLPPTVREEELAPDDTNRVVAAVARRDGFRPGTASVVLRRPLDAAPGADLGAAGPIAPPVPGVQVGPVRAHDRAAVAALHDLLFAGSHLVGDRLVAGEERLVLPAREDEALCGYVVAERQADGTGYLDYLGVTPSARGRGIGAQLVVAACDALVSGWGCPEVHLTVRQDLPVARRLYARLGFVAERLLRPWRRGFAIEPAGR